MFFAMFTTKMMDNGKNTTGRPSVEEIAGIIIMKPATCKLRCEAYQEVHIRQLGELLVEVQRQEVQQTVLIRDNCVVSDASIGNIQSNRAVWLFFPRQLLLAA